MAGKKSGSGGTAAAAQKLAEPYAKQLGLTLWDVRFVKEGASWVLRFFIDKPGGVTIDDCENLSRAVDGPLDEADFIEQSYLMEVSSPGLNRELTRQQHFEAMKGRPVSLRLVHAVDGVRDYEGILEGLCEDCVCIKAEGGALQFPRKSLASVRLIDDDFDNNIGGTEENG